MTEKNKRQQLDKILLIFETYFTIICKENELIKFILGFHRLLTLLHLKADIPPNISNGTFPTCVLLPRLFSHTCP